MADANVPEPPDPREVTERKIGTPLRDAAVEPTTADFLAPTNAGEGNPHGSQVVSPGLHAGATGPIAPGDVPDDTGEQEAKETALASAVFVDGQDVPTATAAVVEGEPAGASARAANGTSDTTPATRTVPAKKAAKKTAAKSEK